MTPVPPLAYAGFWRRLGAAVLDMLVFSIGSTTLLYLMYGPAYLAAPADAGGQPGYHAAETLLGNVVPLILIPLLWVTLGGTPGKLLMGCVVADAATGRRIGWRQALLRLLGYAASALPLGLGFLWVGWDKRKQGLHDRIAGTIVIMEDYARDPIDALAREAP